MSKTRSSPVVSAKGEPIFTWNGNGDISFTNKYVDLERRRALLLESYLDVVNVMLRQK